MLAELRMCLPALVRRLWCSFTLLLTECVVECAGFLFRGILRGIKDRFFVTRIIVSSDSTVNTPGIQSKFVFLFFFLF